MPIARARAKSPGLDWNGHKNGEPNYRGQAFNPAAQGKALREQLAMKVPGFAGFDHAEGRVGFNVQACRNLKAAGGSWFEAGNNSPMRRGHSKSNARKAASAMIAKIPLVLSRHIARSWRPQIATASSTSVPPPPPQ